MQLSFQENQNTIGKLAARYFICPHKQQSECGDRDNFFVYITINLITDK